MHSGVKMPLKVPVSLAAAQFYLVLCCLIDICIMLLSLYFCPITDGCLRGLRTAVEPWCPSLMIAVRR